VTGLPTIWCWEFDAKLGSSKVRRIPARSGSGAITAHRSSRWNRSTRLNSELIPRLPFLLRSAAFTRLPHEIVRVIRAADSFVPRDLRIRTQRARYVDATAVDA